MPRSVEESLDLFESSLNDISTSLTNQEVKDTSKLKLSQVADKIKSIVLKPKTGSIQIRQIISTNSTSSHSLGTITYTINHSGGTSTVKVTGGTDSSYSNYVTISDIPVGSYTIIPSGFDTEKYNVISLTGTMTADATQTHSFVYNYMVGILRINQTVNYPSGFNYKDDKYITFIHTIHGEKLGYQNTDPIVGTKTVDIELQEGIYTFYKQVNCESAGDGAYDSNFSTNSELVQIRVGKLEEVNVEYTRATGSIQIQDRLVSNFTGNSRVYALIQHYLISSEEYSNYFITTPTYSWYGNVGGGTVTVGTIDGVPTGLATLNPVHNRMASSSSTTNADYTWEINTSTGTGIVEKNKTVSITGIVTRVSVNRSNSNIKEDEAIPVSFEFLNEVQSTQISDTALTDGIETIEWNEELGCNIINGLPYYGELEDYPNPLRKVYAKDFTGEIEIGKLTPVEQKEVHNG